MSANLDFSTYFTPHHAKFNFIVLNLLEFLLGGFICTSPSWLSVTSSLFPMLLNYKGVVLEDDA